MRFTWMSTLKLHTKAFCFRCIGARITFPPQPDRNCRSKSEQANKQTCFLILAAKQAKQHGVHAASTTIIHIHRKLAVSFLKKTSTVGRRRRQRTAAFFISFFIQLLMCSFVFCGCPLNFFRFECVVSVCVPLLLCAVLNNRILKATPKKKPHGYTVAGEGARDQQKQR